VVLAIVFHCLGHSKMSMMMMMIMMTGGGISSRRPRGNDSLAIEVVAMQNCIGLSGVCGATGVRQIELIVAPFTRCQTHHRAAA